MDITRIYAAPPAGFDLTGTDTAAAKATPAAAATAATTAVAAGSGLHAGAASDGAAATEGVTASAARVPDLKSAIEAGSKALQGLNQALEFQIDPDSKQAVVKVVDTETNQVIRQMPSEQFLQMAQQIQAFQAHLIQDKA